MCFFSKNIRKFATSPSPILGCYWLYKKLPANRSDCTLELRSELLQRCRRGRGCSELWKNTIFPNNLYNRNCEAIRLDKDIAFSKVVLKSTWMAPECSCKNSIMQQQRYSCSSFGLENRRTGPSITLRASTETAQRYVWVVKKGSGKQ